jgi:hypothetical protein
MAPCRADYSLGFSGQLAIGLSLVIVAESGQSLGSAVHASACVFVFVFVVAVYPLN